MQFYVYCFVYVYVQLFCINGNDITDIMGINCRGDNLHVDFLHFLYFCGLRYHWYFELLVRFCWSVLEF